MAVSYKKLWKLLIDKDMKRKICARKRALARRPSQNGAKWSCYDGNTFENLHGTGLRRGRYYGNCAGFA